mmetsp:Transcript_3587/g.7876  ORF Transcript_3587/g.7876 Transcript_3587/m.7876 type:complete len:333 (+) Transcript_3587:133-1131(+)
MAHLFDYGLLDEAAGNNEAVATPAEATVGQTPYAQPRKPRRKKSTPKEKVEVTLRHAITGDSVVVYARINCTIRSLKKAAGRELGQPDFVDKVKFVRKEGDRYAAVKDVQRLGGSREFLVVSVDLAAAAAAKPSVPDTDQAEETSDESEVEAAEPEEVPVAAVQMRTSKTASTAVQDQGANGQRAEAGFRQSHVKQPVPAKASLDRDSAFQLQRELFDSFRKDDFQMELMKLEMACGTSSSTFRTSRQKLILKVQSKVLPKYGFEGSMAGVCDMIVAMKPLIDDPEFAKVGRQINSLLGLDIELQQWSSLTDALQEASDLEESLAQAQMEPQ